MGEAEAKPHQRTIRLAIAPAEIVLFKSIVESYDNLATLRTADPKLHHLMLYFSADAESDVRSLLDALRARFTIQELPQS